MKILLTGHKGFIGSNMLRALSDHDVVTYNWDDGVRPGVMGFDWVIHMGAISSTTERDVEKVLKQNLDFSIDLFDECKTFGVNLQYSSSASIYGPISTFREDAAPDPRTPYAWSKYLFERYVQRHQGGNIVQGFRYFNVYGASEEHKGSQASPFTQFKQQAKEHNLIKVFEGSDRYCRDFVPVELVCQYHKDFFHVQESGIWNIGTGQTKTFLEIAQQFSVPIQEIPMPDALKNGYQPYTCADMTKTTQTLQVWAN
jgi:ADP-L-glycero-D-manno-heptose 6-epimerase